jgi:hypothetical protein
MNKMIKVIKGDHDFAMITLTATSRTNCRDAQIGFVWPTVSDPFRFLPPANAERPFQHRAREHGKNSPYQPCRTGDVRAARLFPPDVIFASIPRSGPSSWICNHVSIGFPAAIKIFPHHAFGREARVSTMAIAMFFGADTASAHPIDTRRQWLRVVRCVRPWQVWLVLALISAMPTICRCDWRPSPEEIT